MDKLNIDIRNFDEEIEITVVPDPLPAPTAELPMDYLGERNQTNQWSDDVSASVDVTDRTNTDLSLP